MKKIFLIALISSITISAYSQRQSRSADPSIKVKEQSEKIAKELELSDKQIKKLDKIDVEFIKQIETSKKLQEAMKSEGQELLLAYDKDLKAILNESQLKEYELLKLTGKEKFHKQRKGSKGNMTGKKGKKTSRKDMINARQDKMAKKLQFDDKQLVQFKEINSKYDTKREDMRARHKSVVDSKMDMMIDREIKIEKMLNDEQLVEFKKLSKKRHASNGMRKK